MDRFDVLDTKTDILGHYLLEASAGTGKTFAIEHITARLIRDHDFSIDKILIVTFTRAATRELKERIRSTLKSEPKTLAIEHGLAMLDQAQIYTIHGFCHRMLTEFSCEAKLEFEPQSEGTDDYKDALKRHIVDILRTGLTEDQFSNIQLSKLPKNHEDLVDKILHLVEKEGELPVFLSFTEAYEAYLKKRKEMPHFSEDDLEFNKIKNSQGKLKREYQEQFDLIKKESLTKKEFEQLVQTESFLSKLTPTNLSKKAKRCPVKMFEIRKTFLPILQPSADTHSIIIRIACLAKRSAEKKLDEHNITSPKQLLTKMQGALKYPQFSKKVQDKYSAVIIDEFQDTDAIQWNIFKNLFIDNPVKVLFLVGDPKQSIYSFRAADIYTYLSAEKYISSKKRLNTNYRADPQLTEALNSLFMQNKEFLSLSDLPMPYQPVLSPKKENKSFLDKKDPIHFFVGEYSPGKERTWPPKAAELSLFYPFIVQEIRNLKTQGLEYNDLAVLVKDRYQAERMKNYLSTHHIPSYQRTKENLGTTKTYIYIESLLQAYFDPCEKTVKRVLSFKYSHHQIKSDQKNIADLIVKIVHFQNIAELLREFFLPSSEEEVNDYNLISTQLLEFQFYNRTYKYEVLKFYKSIQDQPRCHIPDTNAVAILTIHMSKGLEFGVVFTLGLANRHTSRENLIRSKKDWIKYDKRDPRCQAALQQQKEEKMRMLYVALTRAKHRVYVPILNDLTSRKVEEKELSPLEIFNPKIKDATYLTPVSLVKTFKRDLALKPPLPITKKNKKAVIQSYSSLANTWYTSKNIKEDKIPSGVETGLLFHDIFEEYFRDKNQNIAAIIKKRTPEAYPKDEVFKTVQFALNTPLRPFNFCLNDVDQLYPELEFLYPVEDNYIKGFIDLMFFYAGKYYILDWKTNLLPTYDQKQLEVSMSESDYNLQSNLYVKATKRYLRQLKSGNDYGGMFYLFIRGLPEGGILFRKPNLE